MDNKIKLLISFYEEEKAQLINRIEECIADSEYLIAHYHSKALALLNGRLYSFYSIDGKLHDERDIIQRRIAGLQKEIEPEQSRYVIEYLEKRFYFEKEKLERLNQTSNQATIPDTATLLDRTLKMLIERKIKNLRIILKKSDNLFLRLSYSKNILKITLPYIKENIRKGTFDEDNICSYKRLGFDFAENETRLTLSIAGDKECVLDRLNIILARIVFEIGYPGGFANDSYIQFTIRESR